MDLLRFQHCMTSPDSRAYDLPYWHVGANTKLGTHLVSPVLMAMIEDELTQGIGVHGTHGT